MTEKAWAEAFTTAQAAFPPIAKTKTVDTGSYTYKYADLPSILEAVSPHLEANGLSVGQSVVSEEGRVGVETRIYHTSGHVETFGPVFLTSGSDARAAGSAITYARRYSLCAALGIAADEDDDGAAASRPVRDDPSEDASTWLATRFEIFGLWTPEQKRETAAQLAKEVGAKKPVTREEAELIFKKASEIYYAQHGYPDGEAPF